MTLHAYLEERQTHFYKKNEKVMIEIYADKIYAYENHDENLPQLEIFGGNASVYLPPGERQDYASSKMRIYSKALN